MRIPDTLEVVVALVLMLALGAVATAWGVERWQSEGSWPGAAVAALGALIALYAPLSAMFGWPPLDWLRG